MTSRRKMPSASRIRNFWAFKLSVGDLAKYDSPEECLEEKDSCFACGFYMGPLERAHILARCDGGDDSVSNLHLLCPWCHEASEQLSGEAYWQWFRRRSIADIAFEFGVRRFGYQSTLHAFKLGPTVEMVDTALASLTTLQEDE
jgi:hypothetical protein